jgi:hypothetical protein
LCLNSGKIHLGYFENEIDAAKAYDEAAKRYRGKFAILNFTTEDTEKHRGIYNKKILHHEEQKKHEETK